MIPSGAAPIHAPRRLPILALAFMMFGALPLAGCNDDDNGQAKAAAAAPAVEVGVVTLKPERVAISTELPGRTSAFRIADVRPQVSGIILNRLFTRSEERRIGKEGGGQWQSGGVRVD